MDIRGDYKMDTNKQIITGKTTSKEKYTVYKNPSDIIEPSDKKYPIYEIDPVKKIYSYNKPYVMDDISESTDDAPKLIPTQDPVYKPSSTHYKPDPICKSDPIYKIDPNILNETKSTKSTNKIPNEFTHVVNTTAGVDADIKNAYIFLTFGLGSFIDRYETVSDQHAKNIMMMEKLLGVLDVFNGIVGCSLPDTIDANMRRQLEKNLRFINQETHKLMNIIIKK